MFNKLLSWLDYLIIVQGLIALKVIEYSFKMFVSTQLLSLERDTVFCSQRQYRTVFNSQQYTNTILSCRFAYPSVLRTLVLNYLTGVHNIPQLPIIIGWWKLSNQIFTNVNRSNMKYLMSVGFVMKQYDWLV